LISEVNYLSLSKTNVIWYNLDVIGWSLHKEGEISIVSPEYAEYLSPEYLESIRKRPQANAKLKTPLFKQYSEILKK